jgi:non-lysosomal glucosylceramidase
VTAAPDQDVQVAWRRRLGERSPRTFRPAPGSGASDDGPVQGLALGGIGAGSIGIDHDGRFSRWHLNPGCYRYSPAAGTFLTVERLDRPGGPRALVAPGTQLRGGMATGGQGTYEACFPFATRHQVVPDLDVATWVRTWSPVIPGNYDASAWPVGNLEVTLASAGGGHFAVGFVFEIPADDRILREPRPASLLRVAPVAGGLTAELPELPASFAIAADHPDVRTGVLSDDRAYAAARRSVWAALEEADGTGSHHRLADRPGLAAAVEVTLEPGVPATLVFSLAWDLPRIRFGAGLEIGWWRAHTRDFGTGGFAAGTIARSALDRRPSLRSQAEAWQERLSALLQRNAAPSWLLPALLNELYLMVEGGTAWVVGPDSGPPGAEEHFGILESVDYSYYETLDVRYYSSFALLELWPELERTVIRDYAAAIATADDEQVALQFGGVADRKRAGAAPHDLGGPDEDVFRKLNAYRLHDSSDWKDLNPKFVLQVLRDARLLGDPELARAAWPAVREAMAHLEAMDADGDGLPEHAAKPDQTYDTWVLHGFSAYSGDLWLAALEAAAEIAELAGQRLDALRLRGTRDRAATRLEAALWNGASYRLDSGGTEASESVMADQFAGTWYALLLGLPETHPRDRVQTALTTVLDSNLRGFAGGQLGPVNGRTALGEAIAGNEQASEVWVGVAWGLASLALLLDRDADAWEIGGALYRTLYQESGLWFRTPEAWTEHGGFRAPMYHRGLAIWSLVTALRRREGG